LTVLQYAEMNETGELVPLCGDVVFSLAQGLPFTSCPSGIEMVGMKTEGDEMKNGVTASHNQSQIHDRRAAGLKIKTRIRAGGMSANHNQSRIHDGQSAD
jgi:hypothetical protein